MTDPKLLDANGNEIPPATTGFAALDQSAAGLAQRTDGSQGPMTPQAASLTGGTPATNDPAVTGVAEVGDVKNPTDHGMAGILPEASHPNGPTPEVKRHDLAAGAAYKDLHDDLTAAWERIASLEGAAAADLKSLVLNWREQIAQHLAVRFPQS